MNIPQIILDEIKKHDLKSFKVLTIEHGSVSNAITFLMEHDSLEMAQQLRQMAQGQFIRQGPLEGFVAAGVMLDDGEYIVLSNIYPEYNTPSEITASLVGEVGFLKAFNRATQENELRVQKALQWLAQQKSAPAPVSFIASAAQKTDRIEKFKEKN